MAMAIIRAPHAIISPPHPCSLTSAQAWVITWAVSSILDVVFIQHEWTQIHTVEIEVKVCLCEMTVSELEQNICVYPGAWSVHWQDEKEDSPDWNKWTEMLLLLQDSSSSHIFYE